MAEHKLIDIDLLERYDGKIKDVIEEIDSQINDNNTYEYAPVITIEDAVPANLSDCKVKIEPVQDLHGQSAPYVGGAGKNKVPLVLADIKTINTAGSWSGNVYSIVGGTVTVNTDDGGNVTSIIVNGTFSAVISFNLNKSTIAAGNYIITGGVSDSLAVGLRDENNNTHYDTGAGASYNILSDVADCDAHILIAAMNHNNVAVYPMIRLSTEQDASFAPYTNICPISGHTETSVQRDGKNLAKNIMTQDVDSNGVLWKKNNDGTITVSGTPTDNSYVLISHQAVVNSAMGKITLYCNLDNVSNVIYNIIAFYDADGNNIYNENDKDTKTARVYDLSNYPTIALIEIGFKRKTNTAACNGTIKPQIELGQTATPYEPYQSKTYTIALGDTIYGGEVDFDSGVMTVDRAYFKVTSIDQIARNATYPTAQYKVTGITEFVADASKKPIADRYATGSGSGTINFAGSTTKVIRITTFSTYESLQDAYAEIEGTEICYYVEPTTIQLTPQQIQLLQGQNTLTASTGQISVTVNGLSGAIGSVQEQVNDIAEDVEDVQSGLDTVQIGLTTLGTRVNGIYTRTFYNDTTSTTLNNVYLPKTDRHTIAIIAGNDICTMVVSSSAIVEQNNIRNQITVALNENNQFVVSGCPYYSRPMFIATYDFRQQPT